MSVVTPEQRAGCPKNMEYGPCGGVDFDGSCEVGAFRCVFVDTPTVRWHGDPDAPAAVARPTTAAVRQSDARPAARSVGSAVAQPGADAMRALMATRQIVVADFPGRSVDRVSLAECAAALTGRVDATLAGDSGRSRVQFPPSHRAALIQQAGLPVWTGLNCRDRNRVALEGELAALADVQVAGVHCVTGDHTATGGRSDAQPVFDLDSTRLAALARASGHLVSVAEAPTSPPVDRRAARLREKVLAGAEVCFVNHAGGVEPVRRFIRGVQEHGASPAFIPCVPMVIDKGSAGLLRSFTTLVLPEGFLDRILDAADPAAAGIDAVTELCERMLGLDGVAGVNLSGGASAGAEVAFAEAMATVAERLGL